MSRGARTIDRYAVRLAAVVASAALVLSGCDAVSGSGGGSTSGAGTVTAGADGEADRAAGHATSSPQGSDAYPEELSDEQVLEVVAAMDAALASGDEEAFLAHVSPELQEEQRAWFHAVRNVPMEVRQLRADRVVSRRSPTGTVLHVGLRHQITGADPAPVLEQYRWSLAPDEDTIAVLTETRGRSGDLFGYPQLWDIGPVAVLEGDGVVVIAAEHERALAEDLLPSMEAAAEQILNDFTFLAEKRDQLAVQLMAREDLTAALGGDADLGLLSLRTSPQEIPADRADLRARTDALEHRLIIDVDSARDTFEQGLTAGGLWELRVVGALSAVVGDHEDRVPAAWVVDGIPDWYGVAEDPLARDDFVLWLAEEFESGPPEELPSVRWQWDADPEQLWVQSTWFACYLDDVHGRETLLSLVDQLARVDARYDRRSPEQIFTQTLGASEDEVLTDWQEWTQEQVELLTQGSVEGR
ncbi:hypothetical protein [Ornithinimicrobium sp. Y1694]|uniref:hypothetical protein n=1 Tax=Ornithinimicrobium sp. Y1694 TaxID=3418590 RepID=UPI003CF9C65F